MRKQRKNTMQCFCTIMITIMVVFCLSVSPAFAEAESVPEAEPVLQEDPAEVVVADTIPEFAEEISNDPSEAYIEIEPEEAEDYEESGLYAVQENEDGTTEAVSVYSRKRLIVMDEAEITDTFGATKVVCHEGFQVLLYEDEQETKDAYDALYEIYGDDVIIDQPVRTQLAGQTVGWGTNYMNLSGRTEALEKDGGAPVLVAVIDTGITPEHEVFARTHTKISSASCCVVDGYSKNDYRDDVRGGHGTGTAGIIAESTPANVELLAIKVLDREGNGGFLDVYSGLRIALQQGADVVNMSLGGSMYEETGSGLGITSTTRMEIAFLEDILGRLIDSGATVVCSAGNDGYDIDEWKVYPAKSRYTVTVGAIDQRSIRAVYSNTGRAVDYVAPGSGVTVATNYRTGANRYDRYQAMNGTSFSAPYVSAAAALCKSTDPEADQEQVMRQLDVIAKDLGPAGWDEQYGYGVPVFAEARRASRTLRPAEAETTPITSARVTGIKDKAYSGAAQTQDLTVRMSVGGYGITLENGTDYTVSYKNNKNIGTATMTITGKGIYSGTITKTFRILAHGLCNGSKGWGVYRNGALNTGATGFYKSGKTWYFIRNGLYDKKFTGLAKSSKNGKYYFARNGILDWNFTGVAKSVTNGKWYFARKGALDWSYTGGAKSVANGKWYYVRKGALKWNYNGRAKGTDGRTRRYIRGKAR